MHIYGHYLLSSCLVSTVILLALMVCVCVCSEIGQVADIAEAVQVKLDSYKADKRELGSVSAYNTCNILVHIPACIHTHIHTWTYLYIHTHNYLQAYIYTHTCMHTYMHTHTYLPAYMHILSYIYMHSYVD